MATARTCARRSPAAPSEGVGVAVLKVGSSPAGSAAAAAHTGALAGDQRIFRALVEEAGGAWASDFHELLELAKAFAVPGARRPSAGLAVLTCSGGDSALAADECERIGIPLPALAPATRERMRELLPEAATVANPLDYTALIWGDTERLHDLVVTAGEDPEVGRVLVLYDQPAGLEGAIEESWAAVREGIRRGARDSAVPVMVASTLPELLDDEAGARFAEAGIPAISGLRSGLAAVAALGRPPGDPVRLREIASAAAASPETGGGWLSEHEAKELLRERGLPVVEGRLVADEDDAVAALVELGGRAAAKLAAASLQHKSDIGALALDIRDDATMREVHARLTALAVPGAAVLVERMAEPGAELLVSARADGVVPSLVIAAGGLWTELLGDAAVVPLPATPERVERAIAGLRAAPLFTGGRGRPALDVAGRRAARRGDRRAPAREGPRARRAEPGARPRARCDRGRRGRRGTGLRVAVAGAGLAGLSAADELRRAGAEVDGASRRASASAGASGRAGSTTAPSSRWAPSTSCPATRPSASWPPGSGSGCWDKGMAYGRREPRGGAATSHEQMAAAVPEIERALADVPAALSAQEFLDGLDIDAGVREALLARVEISSASPADRGRRARPRRHRARRRGACSQRRRRQPGAARSALAAELGDAVRLSSPVERIEWSSSGVRVRRGRRRARRRRLRGGRPGERARQDPLRAGVARGARGAPSHRCATGTPPSCSYR